METIHNSEVFTKHHVEFFFENIDDFTTHIGILKILQEMNETIKGSPYLSVVISFNYGWMDGDIAEVSFVFITGYGELEEIDIGYFDSVGNFTFYTDTIRLNYETK